jgi:glucose-6-phosphate isomerase
MKRFYAALGRYEAGVQRVLRSLDQQGFSEKLWARDASLWKGDPEDQKKIKNRLGWLTLTKTMIERVEELKEFARSIKVAGFTHVLLLGMGGSSLCPEVCRKTYGITDGNPDLFVLDSTDPDTILNIEKSVHLKTTLFILASKSGTTIEIQSLYRYFSSQLEAVKRSPVVGEHFLAITDPGTFLERLAREQGFRRLFLTPPDIGGRYSALSYFGLVPLALIGVDLKAFLARAEEVVQASLPYIPAADNPGLKLGAILGELGQQGRDKVTLICSQSIGSFGYWVEQLIAESTGKEGKGLVPIEGEGIGEPPVYGDDRLFIYLSVDTSKDRELDQGFEALQQAGHPVVRIHLRDPLDLAGEFFRWEVASAVAGAILNINPFDEPNVTESKENTLKVLEEFQKTGHLPPRQVLLEEKGIRLFGNFKAPLKSSLGEAFRHFMDQSRASDYVALMAYLERSDTNESLLQRLRTTIRDRYHLATTLGYGPRFLHSTGQLHKGGPKTGLFIQVTAEDREDPSIPGQPYGFSLLKQAQALGDYLALILIDCTSIPWH